MFCSRVSIRASILAIIASIRAIIASWFVCICCKMMAWFRSNALLRCSRALTRLASATSFVGKLAIRDTWSVRVRRLATAAWRSGCAILTRGDDWKRVFSASGYGFEIMVVVRMFERLWITGVAQLAPVGREVTTGKNAV